MITLIFDCDGVLADTERDGHLPAFNQTFEEFGLPIRWTEDAYGEALKIGGGKERMTALLTSDFVAAAGLPRDREAQQARVAEWHRRKTEIFTQRVRAGRLPARPGIKRLTSEARLAGWQLAVCSTSAEPAVQAILDHTVGVEAACDFLVLAGDVVPRKKPAPDIYLLALDRLGAEAAQTVVIEDSRNGLLAATAAGLTTLVTVNSYTRGEDLAQAALVVSSLGDPEGPASEIILNHSSATPGSFIALTDVEALLI